MSKRELIDRVMYLLNSGTIGDDNPIEVILDWISLSELQSLNNRLEQLYIKDLIYKTEDDVEDVSILDNGTFQVHYLNGPTRIYNVGLDKDILFQTCWEPIHGGYYKREIK